MNKYEELRKLLLRLPPSKQLDRVQDLFDELISEIQEFAWDSFVGRAHYDKEKDLYDSCALSSVCDAGDKLVELGVLTRIPDGFGRRWFYRMKKTDPIVEKIIDTQLD